MYIVHKTKSKVLPEICIQMKTKNDRKLSVSDYTLVI